MFRLPSTLAVDLAMTAPKHTSGHVRIYPLYTVGQNTITGFMSYKLCRFADTSMSSGSPQCVIQGRGTVGQTPLPCCPDLPATPRHSRETQHHLPHTLQVEHKKDESLILAHHSNFQKKEILIYSLVQF